MNNVAATNSTLLINEARNLQTKILEGNDPFEENLARNSNRILATLGGAFLLGVGGGLGFGYLADASVDNTKLSKMKATSLILSAKKLDTENPNFEKEKIAKELQLKVIENLEPYTETAKTTKRIIAAGALMVAVAGQYFLVRTLVPNVGNAQTDTIFTAVADLGLLSGGVALTYRVFHWLNEGSKVKQNNLALVHQTLSKL